MESNQVRQACCRGLIIAAHGSRKIETTQEIVSLVTGLKKKSRSDFTEISPGFLGFGIPKIQNVIEEFIEKGISEIVVFPFFIASGTHLLVDIPDLIQNIQKKYPHVRFVLTQHLGGCKGVGNLILNQIKNELALFKNDESQ